jgi:hypothetical protein
MATSGRIPVPAAVERGADDGMLRTAFHRQFAGGVAIVTSSVQNQVFLLAWMDAVSSTLKREAFNAEIRPPLGSTSLIFP